MLSVQLGIMPNKKIVTESGVNRIDTSLASGGAGLAIEYGGRLHVIGERPFVIGRSPSADLVIDHSAVSRRHARIVRSKDGYLVEDLESRNGVSVDAHAVKGSAPLFPGVILTLGDVSVVMRTARRSLGNEAQELGEGSLSTRRERDDDTGPVDGLLLFMTAVDEALLKGETRDAERAFARYLGRAAERAAQNGRLEASAAQTVALLSLRLGEATQSSVWLDFVVRLYSSTGTLVPLTVVNAMQALARKLGGVDRSALRQYAAALQGRNPYRTIEENCVLDRLAALAASRFTIERAAG